MLIPALLLLLGVAAVASKAGKTAPPKFRAGTMVIDRAIVRPMCWPTAQARIPLVGMSAVPVPPRGAYVTTDKELAKKKSPTGGIVLLWTPCNRALLPSDASLRAGDVYSLGAFTRLNPSGGIFVDEWDRPYGGKKKGGFFSDFFDSPFWDVVTGAAYFIPGLGPAVSAGLTCLVSMARGEAASEALAKAGCAALSPAAAVACKAAVGAAASGLRGESLREAGEKTITELGGERGAWDAGIAAWESLQN